MLVGCLALALALTAGCVATTSGNGGGNGGGTGGGTTAASPTTTATKAPTTCTQVSGFGAAVAATAVTGFNYGLPNNTVEVAPKTSAGGAGQYKIYDIDLCTPNTTPELPVGANQRPLATALQFYGWGMMHVFPLTGDALKACPAGDVCYGYSVETKNTVEYFDQAPQFLALENVKDRGNGLVTYHLKLAGPPAAPNCGYDANFDSLDQTVFGSHPVYQLYLGAPPHTANNPFSAVQLPPVTRMYSEGATGHIFYHLCSAGTAASVESFMFTQLTSNGWVGCMGQPAPTAAGGCFAYTFTATCGSQTVQITIGLTDAKQWGFGYGKPCFGA
jgi:hypothetical protein